MAAARGPALGTSPEISPTSWLADADPCAVTGRTPSSRFDSAQRQGRLTPSASARRSCGPCGPKNRKDLRFFRMNHLCGNISDVPTLTQRRLDAQTQRVRRTFRVTSHLKKLAEFLEYATKVGQISGLESRLARPADRTRGADDAKPAAGEEHPCRLPTRRLKPTTSAATFGGEAAGPWTWRPCC